MTVIKVTLSPDIESFIEAEISSGEYDSVSDVLDEALRAMMSERLQDAEKQRVVSHEIAVGLAEARAGVYSSRSVRDIAQAVLRGTDED